jgi:hypothetical protein
MNIPKHSLQLLHHIFGVQPITIDSRQVAGWELALEWIYIALNFPEMPLPAIALSGARNSGKSTFINWMHFVFKQLNYKTTYLPPGEVLSFHNEWAACNLITIDSAGDITPGSIRHIKKYLLSEHIAIHRRGQNMSIVKANGRFVLAYNGLYDPAARTEMSVRFWTVKVPECEGVKDDIAQLLRSEVLQFLEVLRSRNGVCEPLYRWLRGADLSYYTRPVDSENQGRFYVKTDTGTTPPQFIHDDVEKAITEAKRLSIMHRCGVEVLKIVGKVHYSVAVYTPATPCPQQGELPF